VSTERLDCSYLCDFPLLNLKFLLAAVGYLIALGKSETVVEDHCRYWGDRGAQGADVIGAIQRLREQERRRGACK